MNNNLTKAYKASPLWVAALAFSLPFLSLITLSGTSATSYLLLLSALLSFKECRAALARHWHDTRLVVTAFLINFVFVLLCFVLRPEASANHLEKPLRMLLAVSALALVLARRPSRQALWWGAVGGALACLPFVAYQRFDLAQERPGGLINAITFGDLALLLGLLSLVAAIDLRHSRARAALAALGALAGLLASLLTGTRGGLLALVPAAVIFYVLSRHERGVGQRVRLGLLAGTVLLAGAYFVPALGLEGRMAEGLADVRAWDGGGNKVTNVGIRLELWKGAIMLIRDHPLFGIEPNLMKMYLGRYVAAGALDPVVLTMPHLHNAILQALATGGIPGLLAWFGMFAAPFVYFVRAIGARGAASAAFAPALAGLLVVTSYFCFGLTEVIFWSMKACLFYALTVFLLVGFCQLAKEEIGK
ncbi:O-antigen ligase family protein [Massilia agilis]|uniref:O-antigen ligase family protein n=1 Tax=Massilia agilis TaxID=1811226 RepID=A0ABT2D904_9BURK|nr:O-antigen ligase family protein [Massilia agilis]MCS0807647.1 O-antigen ligase family protein [Massilia agilis]